MLNSNDSEDYHLLPVSRCLEYLKLSDLTEALISF